MKFKLKEIQKWLRGLEENKWRRRYKVDAKRITHFLNNGADATLPQSLSRKNENATYNRERSLAKQYVKNKVDEVYSTFNKQEIDELFNKINNNETK